MAGRPVIGLDIGTSGVRAAELSISKSGVTLNRFGQVALPVDAVRNGEVMDVAAVAAAIKQLWSQAKFSGKKVVVGVANQRVIVRQVDLPWLPMNEFRKALPFQVQDYIPMPVDDVILDFHPLEEFTGEGGTKMLRVLLVAAVSEMVSRSLEAVSRAGLNAHTVDLNSFAVLRSMAHADTGLSTSATAIVDVGASVTNIVVHQGGVPRFVRILLMGGFDITDSVAERMGVSIDQAESIKQTTGLAMAGSTSDSHPAARAVEAAGSALVEEVRGSLDYFTAQAGSVRLDRILLSGGGSRLQGLPERLQAATRLPVEVARPMSLLSMGKTGLTPDQLAYVEPMATVPVGLALGVSS